MIKVSVIVPIYNTEEYVQECLDSIINQTLRELEIICIDDGSTDSSLQILQQYAKQDERIKIVQKENGGLVSARKAGLQVATGQYVGYVDSDDWIEPNMYEELYSAAIKENADMVTSGYFLEGNYTTEHLDTVEEGVYKDGNLQYLRDNTIYRLDKKETGLRASLCCKLFSKELLMKAQMAISEKLTMAEDKICLLNCVLESKIVIVHKKSYYHYRLNLSSMVHTPNIKYLLSVNEVYQSMISLYSHPNFSPIMRVQAELYMTELIFKGINTLMGFQHRNLLWIDPSWLNNIPTGAKVVLYGGGELGIKYRTHLNSRKDLQYVASVDFGYEKFAGSIGLLVQSPDILSELEYDYIVITIKNPTKATQVRMRLEEIGITPEKIIWQEQPEIFWKYAEADGLLETVEEYVVETGEIYS